MHKDCELRKVSIMHLMKGLFVNSVAVAVSLVTLCHPLVAWTSVREIA